MSEFDDLKKKIEYANKFLVFFLLYDVMNEEIGTNYVTIKVKNLFAYENLFNMTNDFVENNKIENVDLFLKDVFCFLQEKNFLQIKSDNNDLYNYLKNSTITVKANNPELENYIISIFNQNPYYIRTSKTYTEIHGCQHKKFKNYYTNEYIKVFLRYLCDKKTLIEISQNTYVTYEDFNK